MTARKPAFYLVARDAITGRFVPLAVARRRKKTTVVERRRRR